MVVQYIERKLIDKSKSHRAALKKLGQSSEEDPLSDKVILLEQTSQLRGMSTIIQDIDTSPEDFIFYFDRLATLLVEQLVFLNQIPSLTNDAKCNEQYLL
jgi:uridine kinase